MSGIKTGNKGFVNPKDGKVYSLDPGVTDVNPVGSAYDPGDMTVDQTIKDISKPTRITLGTYLSNATKGIVGSTNVSNKYTIDSSTDASIAATLVDATGYPMPVSPTTNSSKFAGNLQSSFSDDFSSLQGAAGQDKVKKGLSANVGKDGNELLAQTSTVFATQTIVSAYQKFAFTPNYRGDTALYNVIPNTFSDNILFPDKSFNPQLINFDKLTKVLPNDEAVVAGLLTFDLADAVQIPKNLTTINVYPVQTPTINKFVVDNLSSITTTGYPTALTPPKSQNPSPDGTKHFVFANPYNNSYTNYYTDLNVNTTIGLNKGKVAAERLITGHTFLSNVTLASNKIAPTVLPLLTYTTNVVTSNTFDSTIEKSFVDLGSLSNNFEPKINSVKSLGKYRGQPGDIIEFFPLTLDAATYKPATITDGKNKFPIEYPTSVGPKMTSLSINERPAPLSSADSQNENNTFAGVPGTLDSSFTENYPAFSEKMQKGKSFDKLEAPDGNDLLPDAAEKAESGGFYIKNALSLNEPIATYTHNVLVDNMFRPTDPAVGFFQGNAFLDSNIDMLSPRPSFEPQINKINSDQENGAYTDAAKYLVTLDSLQQKAIDDTTKNEYSLDKKPAELSSITDLVTGLPDTISSNNTNSYVPRNLINPISNDPSIQNFSKGKEVKNTINGNTLLRFGVEGNLNTVGPDAKTKKGIPVGNSATGIAEVNPLYNYTGVRGSSVLNIGNNRFAAEALSYATFNGTLKLKDGTEVPQLKMASVGAGLMLRASAEIPAWHASPDGPTKFNPNDGWSSAGAIIPSVVQAGLLKVNNVLLEAQDVFNALDDDAAVADNKLTSIAPFDGQSWGTTNNPEEMFDDALGIGSSILMLAMVLAISVLFGALQFFTGGKGAGRKIVGTDGRMSLGKYKFSGGNIGGDNTQKVLSYFNPDELLGVYVTNNNYENSLYAGTKAFFLGGGKADVSLGDIALGAVGIGLDSIIGDASVVGSNLTVCRTIIRSGLVLAQQMETLSNSQNIVAGIKSGLNIFKAMRSSKLIKAMNVFASLGDILLDMQKGPILPGPDGRPVQTPNYGFENVDPALLSGNKINGSQQTHTKSRLTYKNNYDSSLAWGAARAPALYLTDSSIQGLSLIDGLGSFKGALGLSYKTAGGVDQPSYHHEGINGRIGSTVRERIEKMLDAEYVPFYFHDVRTNEIISFHAFLASLSDDYTSSYETVDGIGRIESVKIYKGTTRKIGMSFYVAATSESDFDHMWVKINKLTTLIYPQYTKGRDLLPTSENGRDQYRFTAPFSQIPGASPLIRIRLGDLLRSNYSKFALARIFGAGRKGGKMALPTNATTLASTTINTDISTSIKDKLADFIANPEKYANFKRIDVDASRLIPLAGNVEVIDAKRLAYIQLDAPEQFRLGETVAVTYYNTHGRQITADFNKSSIFVTAAAISKKRDELLKGDDPAAAALTSFLEPNGNAIVKSFENAGGKGLAGVIESMNFDWYDKVTWETLPGMTAPKLCKVTISFSPIHDISPGIDHAGYNRAPIYPVGRGMAPSKIKFE